MAASEPRALPTRRCDQNRCGWQAVQSALMSMHVTPGAAQPNSIEPLQVDIEFCPGGPDGLPGLTVDKFGDCLSFQIVSLGMERMRDDILAILAEVFRPQCIYERDDLAVREKEGMEQRKGCVYGAVPPELIIREHDALMAVDIENGQKTGHFLDQQENRGHLRPYSAGRTVLDLCCHTGGFSNHAALYGAAHVQAVDVSETALAMVRGNAARNGVADRVETVCANVFDLVRQDCEEGRQFGLVICDPPAFAKSRSALDGAYRGYRELNRRCMQLTEPGGFLVTCSCSQFMTQPLFEQMLTEAAKGAGRQVRLLERLLQSRDHPPRWARSTPCISRAVSCRCCDDENSCGRRRAPAG